MRWPWRRREPAPSEDARHVVEHANRQLVDTQALGRAADDLVRRADEINDRWRETARTNHVREAVEATIRRRTRRP